MENIDNFSEEQITKVDRIINTYGRQRGKLIGLLEKIQIELGYVPDSIQKRISEKTGIPEVKILGVLTFYSYFSTKPRARHRIQQCMGTTCFVKGGKEIASKIEQDYHVKIGESTSDGRFTYEQARCVGACGLAPVMIVDGTVYGKVTPDQVDEILSQFK